jgi:hypothetical protein
MPITLDHGQIQTALKEFDIKEYDYYLLFDQNVYMVWCTTGAKALQLVIENSCISLDYKGEWYYYSELPSDHVVPTYACVKYIFAVN